MNSVLAEGALPGGRTLQLVQGDITTETVDAIVNAANETLQHGGGLAAAISRSGGPAIQEESDEWVRRRGRVSHEQPAWTSGGRLPARYVIHAVGPVWGLGDEDARLAAAVRGSLEVADGLHCASVALPAISTGIFGFPKERAARIILEVIPAYFREAESGIRLVRLTLLDRPTVDAFRQAWESGR